jgi:hypothetical protein
MLLYQQTRIAFLITDTGTGGEGRRFFYCRITRVQSRYPPPPHPTLQMSAPMYVFPEMKLRGLVISETEL